MRTRAVVLILAITLIASGLASAQQLTGEVFGKMTDLSGGAMPGVTVTLTSPVW